MSIVGLGAQPVSGSGIDLTASVFNVRNYGAKADGITSDSAAIQAAINASVTGADAGVVFLPAGSYKLTSALLITDVRTRIVGSGRTSAVLKPSSDSAITINVNNTGTHGPYIESLGFYVTAGVPGKFVLDSQNGSVTLRDVWISGVQGVMSTWAGAVRLQETNWSMVDNIQIAGSGTDRWAIGVDVCPNSLANRGNVTFVGGLIYRCQIGARIAFNNPGLQVINNIGFFNTKFLWTGDGASVGGTGIQAFTSRMLTLHGVHFESFDVPIDGTSLFCVDVSTCRFVGTTPGGPFSIGVSLKSACNHVTIKNNEFDTGQAAPSGIAVQTDATAHAEIEVSANRYVNVATIWNDLATSSNRVLWTKDPSGRSFWFKDKVFANAYVTAQANVTLVSGNNNNLALPFGGFIRATIDAAGSALTGLVAPSGVATGSGYIATFYKVAGAGAFTITNNDGASSAGNRILTPTGGTITVTWAVVLIYDASSTIWRVQSFV